MNNQIERWNEHVIRGNKLSRDLENIEDLIEKSKGEDICFTAKPSGATYISVLSPEKMQELRESVVMAIMKIRDEKAAEIEMLMGTRKPATINPEFDEATKDMFQPDPVEEKLTEILKDEAERIESKPSLGDNEVDNVRRMYHDEAKTMKEIAAYYGVTKSQMNTFISKHSLRRTSYKNDGFMDAEVEARRIANPEPLRAQNDTEKCRTCGKAVQFTKKVTRDMWPYKYRRRRNGKDETVYCCSREHYLTGKAKDA